MREDQRDVRDKLERFRESIMRQAGERAEQIDRELEAYRASEFGKYEDDVRKDSSRFLQEEESRIGALADHAVSQRRAELKRRLYERRGELTEEVFSKAEKRLREFAASPGYGKLLLQKAEKAGKLRQGGGMLLGVRPEDLRWKDELEAACGEPCRVEPDESIRLGGLRFQAEATGLEGDETLDAALEEQRQWFYENAGLFLKQEQGGEQA